MIVRSNHFRFRNNNANSFGKQAAVHLYTVEFSTDDLLPRVKSEAWDSIQSKLPLLFQDRYIYSGTSLFSTTLIEDLLEFDTVVDDEPLTIIIAF